jgi:hypothetical protein
MALSNYISEINKLNNSIIDRKEFHLRSGDLLVKMASDKQFWYEVFKQNLTDKGYLKRSWSMYEIPFLYVYENDDFYVKVHMFVPLASYAPHVIASAIHHHNNYLLTTHAAFGSGYETILFEKQFTMDPKTKEVNLKIREHFTQKDRPVHLVDAWEPHVVVNPTSLSATLIIWSPDKKRITDSLRSNPILKAIKTPLRKIIYALGFDSTLGIAAKDTHQYYLKDGKFYGVPEDEFFAPTRAQIGPEVDDYSIQTVFAFMQRMGFNDETFLKAMKQDVSVPTYYHKWINMLLNNDTITDTFAKEQINVPGGRIMVEDVLKAAGK